MFESLIGPVTFATASALEANKHQDGLVKTHVYFPFYIQETSKMLRWNKISWQIWKTAIVFWNENFIFQWKELRILTGPSSCSLRLGDHN